MARRNTAKKAGQAAVASSTSTSAKPRQSKLAKEHDVTPQEENEIREAFRLFAEPLAGEKEGVLPLGDVKSVMIALGIPPSSPAELSEFLSILDPDDQGYAPFEPFFAICALKFHARDNDDDAHRQELEEAFHLFVRPGAAGTHGHGKITVAHLRQVAALLKEEVDEEALHDMILEANGGAGLSVGVDQQHFDDVMRRAGVWR